MIRSVPRLHAAPGRAGRDADRRADLGPLGRSNHQRWVADPRRADVSRRLADLLGPETDEPAVGSVFEPVGPGSR